MAGFVSNEMQDSWTDYGMVAPHLCKDIPYWYEILEDLQQEDQSLVCNAPAKLQLSPQHFQQQLQHQNLQSCLFLPPSQFPETEQNHVSFQNQISPNDRLRRHNSNFSESEGLVSPQIDTDGAAAAADQRCQQRIQQQSYRQQLRPQAPSQSNLHQMPDSSMFIQTPQQTITPTRKKSSKMSPVHQTESQPVEQSPEKRRNVQDIEEFRKLFKQIRRKLGLTRGAVASDLTIMYHRESKRREISEFEEDHLRYEKMWELKCLLERWFQDNDSQKMRILKEMLQFSKIFRQKRLERGFLQTEAASAIGKLNGCCVNPGNISKFEDFSMSLSYMCRLKPLLQRWLTDTESPSNCSMHFPPPVTTLVTTSMVPVPHRSTKADCESSATSIDHQHDSARSDDTQQTTSQISPNAQLRPHHSNFSEYERVSSSQVAADTTGAAAAAEQQYEQRIQQQSYRQQLRPQAPSQSNPLRKPDSSMFMKTPQQIISQTQKKSSKMSLANQTESQPAEPSPEEMRNVQDIQEFRKIFKQIRRKLGLRRDALALDLTIIYDRYTFSREISQFEKADMSYENMWELKCLLERWFQDNDSEKMGIIKYMLQFSKIFRQKRLERGFSQTDVASTIGKLGAHDVNQKTISMFEAFSLTLSYK